MNVICWGFLGIVSVCDVPDPPKPTAVICPPVIEWKKADQQAAAEALANLPAGHPLRKMSVVAIRQRDVNRACRN